MAIQHAKTGDPLGTYSFHSVGCRGGILGSRETNEGVGCIIDTVKAFSVK